MSNLVLKKSIDGWRHSLDGRAVHCGDQLELKHEDKWVSVRYEGNLSPQLESPEVFLDSDIKEIYTIELDYVFRWPAE